MANPSLAYLTLLLFNIPPSLLLLALIVRPRPLEDAKHAIQLSTGAEVAIFAVDQAGPIDVLNVNQGVFVSQELEKQGMDESSRKDRGPASITLMSSQAGQVGIYGYTAYSASKFGLRSLAEALQQEVIGENIHVSVVFPPETETPGSARDQLLNDGSFAEWDLSLGSTQSIVDDFRENEKRPQVASIIVASSGAMEADEVAKKALDGIKLARFIIPCNFEGFMLSIVTAGLSPQRSFLMGFIEVIAAGVIRIVALFFQWNWYGSIEKWHAHRKYPISPCVFLLCMLGKTTRSGFARGKEVWGLGAG
ncbi:unnamed protein product [Dovyalis caffra]|uniref:3-ketodihydrosphingosine reductase n=1 Tax=Dovyalis caffra TaxID=77055 RepID=A0AAV1RWK7_9ROSI|nr:unnamed protein product [Dovyalis caffra]